MVPEQFLLFAFSDGYFGNIGFSLENGGGFADTTFKNTYRFDVAAWSGYLLTQKTLGYVFGGYN